jgi:Transglycosylase SLT domain
LERLYFGARNRRKARFKRYLRLAGTISILALLLGLPGFDVGLNYLQRITGAMPGVVAGESSHTAEDSTGLSGLRRPAAPSPENDRTRDATVPDPPLPSPSPLPSGETITNLIYNAAAEFGVSGDYLLSVAQCESGLNPGAYNPAGYHGLFQFDFETWGAYGYGSIYDPVAQARTAAELLSAGQASRWPNCA